MFELDSPRTLRSLLAAAALSLTFACGDADPGGGADPQAPVDGAGAQGPFGGGFPGLSPAADGGTALDGGQGGSNGVDRPVDVAVRYWTRAEKAAEHPDSIARYAVENSQYVVQATKADRFVTHGTLTEGAGEGAAWTYAAEPADRLELHCADGTKITLRYTRIEGALESIGAFIQGEHQLEVRISGNGFDLVVTSRRGPKTGTSSSPRVLTMRGRNTIRGIACDFDVTLTLTTGGKVRTWYPDEALTTEVQGTVNCGDERATLQQKLAFGYTPNDSTGDYLLEGEEFRNDRWTKGSDVYELRSGYLEEWWTKTAGTFKASGDILLNGARVGMLTSEALEKEGGLLDYAVLQVSGKRVAVSPARQKRR